MKITVRTPGRRRRDRIRITLGRARRQRGFAAGTALTPDGGGYRLGVHLGAYKAYQEAGRALAAAGVRRPVLYFERGLHPTSADLLDFLTGLCDMRHSLVVRADISAQRAARLEQRAALLCAYRRLADLPAREAGPQELSEIVIGRLEEACRQRGQGHLQVRQLVRGGDGFECCRGLAAVGRASARDPRLVVIDFVPGRGRERELRPQLALVGKGITFDSGGYDLKPPTGMATMRTDKCGAVYMAGALDFAIRAGLDRPVRLYLCLSENLVGSSAMLPGDIIEYADGTTVEVTNTDAEGRLVLADGLLHAARAGIPTVISAATLTGAAKVALGRDMCAVFARGNRLPGAVTRAFEACHEDFWPMPLRPYHQKMLSSKRADLVNAPRGDGIPGASTAAAFLNHFAGRKARFIHIDLANAYCVSGSPYYAPGPTGACILSLSRIIRKL